MAALPLAPVPLLHGLGTDFYHKTVTTQQVEAYISRYAKKDLSKIFDQYLRTTKIPVLEYKMNSNTLVSYHWTNCVKGFNMPIRVTVAGQPELWITPTEDWNTLSLTPPAAEAVPVATADSANIRGADSSKPAAKAEVPASVTGASGAQAAGGAPVFAVDRNFYITVKKLG